LKESRSRKSTAQAGPGRHVVFDAALRDEALAQLDAQSALRAALDAGELVLHYQPVVATATGRVTGYEALLRWPGATLSTCELLALAEESGLVVPMGAWVLREACAQLARWRGRPGGGELTVSVNVTGRELADPGYPRRVSAALAAAELPSSALRVEVSERAITRDPDGVAAAARALARETGVRAHIDDFGAGPASLRALHGFPAEVVKLDRAFLAELGAGAGSEASLGAIVALAHALGLTVVAEGVETAEQLARAARAGCDGAQGYAIAEPAPPDRVVAP
jgi:EAL domain-containing protein (putative c-di-GMP-specific phosphodiesterase class I)